MTELTRCVAGPQVMLPSRSFHPVPAWQCIIDEVLVLTSAVLGYELRGTGVTVTLSSWSDDERIRPGRQHKASSSSRPDAIMTPPKAPQFALKADPSLLVFNRHPMPPPSPPFFLIITSHHRGGALPQLPAPSDPLPVMRRASRLRSKPGGHTRRCRSKTGRGWRVHCAAGSATRERVVYDPLDGASAAAALGAAAKTAINLSKRTWLLSDARCCVAHVFSPILP